MSEEKYCYSLDEMIAFKGIYRIVDGKVVFNKYSNKIVRPVVKLVDCSLMDHLGVKTI